MSSHAIALLAAAGGVGLGHAIMPDHWMPLAVVGRSRRYPLSRVARLSASAGVTHVLVSVILGTVIVVVGLQFRHAVESAQDTIVGAMLLLTGIVFAVLALLGKRTHGHDHHRSDDHQRGHADAHEHWHEDADEDADKHWHAHEHADAYRSSGLLAIIVPFGAAASPDLTILPVFLAAAAVGVGAAIGSLLVFAAVTIGTIVGLTLAATKGGYQIHGAWLERWSDALTAGVLLVIGALALTGVI